MIIGPPGAGKTSLATALGSKLSISVHHVDQLYFAEEWKARPLEEFLEHHAQVLEQPEWILDGNAARSFPQRARRAQLLLYLRPPRILCCYRVLKRYLSHLGRPRSDRPFGCLETINFKLFKYLWHYDKKYRPQILALKRQNPKLSLLEIRKVRLSAAIRASVSSLD